MNIKRLISKTVSRYLPNNRLKKPKNFQEMLKLALLISKYFEFVRVDFYANGNEIFIGEITHTHETATEKFMPDGISLEKKISKILFF
jgi:hypothetical protein